MGILWICLNVIKAVNLSRLVSHPSISLCIRLHLSLSYRTLQIYPSLSSCCQESSPISLLLISILQSPQHSTRMSMPPAPLNSPSSLSHFHRSRGRHSRFFYSSPSTLIYLESLCCAVHRAPLTALSSSLFSLRVKRH